MIRLTVIRGRANRGRCRRRPSRHGRLGAGIVGLMLGGALIAQPAGTPPGTAPSAQGEVAVTIYNGDLALVQDKRVLTLSAGRSRQEFPDVSAQIRPETATLEGGGFTIIEQNFDFDLLTPAALMQKAVGQEVTLVRTNPANGAEVRERARILAANGGVVMQIGSRIEVLRDDNLPVRVIFDAVPPNLRARPTLSVTMSSAQAGRQPVTLTYLTPGLGWSADYVALFDEAKGLLDVQGWITLTNQSGTTYHQAKTLLVAGNVDGVQPQWRGGYRPPQPTPRIRQPGTETANRERLGGYYLYPLAERTTIANRQTKQVSFLDVKATPATRAYEYRVGWLASQLEPKSVDTAIRFSSSKDGGLGDALPAGTMRFYQRDARGQPQFVGERQIPHTPMGSSLSLTTGDAFDVKIKVIEEERTRINSSRWKTRMRYVLTNAGNAPVTVDVIQTGLWGDVRVEAQSQPGERRDADSMLWKINVPANGEAAVTATFDTRY